MLRSGAAWAKDAARAVDARRLLRTFLARAVHASRTPVPRSLALDAALVVSELLSNAIRHAPGPTGLILQLTGDELAITVWDTSPTTPAAVTATRTVSAATDCISFTGSAITSLANSFVHSFPQ
ncbi:ATP-binding protein [Streptomyces sp. NY05-11A]|uniref:ATP-binding protein n=1 Tax=Streptomyces soliscabiei TaxID=588897 RepID=UPI0029A9C6CB|nr:ATP-binding protein [Streptomyces sp. NY05-11A]MDX2683742.1 ATP-binding protein [Streptomyces sp. NY05-11A]